MPKPEKIDIEALDRELDTVLPNSDNDDRYRTHCCRCGVLLIEYETDWDGHRNERGQMYVRKEYVERFDRYLCMKCNYFILTQLILALKKLK